MTIGYFEKIKKDLLNKKCYLTNNFFTVYNIIQHKEIINQKDIWTISQIVYDENLEDLVVKFKNNFNELCAAKYSDWYVMKNTVLTYVSDQKSNNDINSNGEETFRLKDIDPITETTGDPVFTIVEKMPKYIDGEEGLFKYLSRNLKYPKKEKDNGISGTVYVQFIVNKYGKVEQAEIKRGVSGGPNLDTEALRIVNSLEFVPGEQNGKKVSVYYNLPIKFSLK